MYFSRFFAILLIFATTTLQSLAQESFNRETCDVSEMTEGNLAYQTFKKEKLNAAYKLSSDITNGKGKFWKITSPEGKVSHIWGTFHSTDRDILNLPESLRQTIKEADFLLPEIDASSATRAELNMINNAEGIYYDGLLPHPVLTKTDPSVSKWIEARFQQLGYGVNGKEYVNGPFLAEMLLYEPCDDFNFGIYPIQDDRISLLAREAGAKIVGLESRYALRDKLAKDTQVNVAMVNVFGTYLDPHELGYWRALNFDVYKSGDLSAGIGLDQLYVSERLGKEEAKTNLERMDAYLLEERNQIFFESALPYLKQGGALLAVGYFHLPKETGMVSLLQNAGFTTINIPLEQEQQN